MAERVPGEAGAGDGAAGVAGGGAADRRRTAFMRDLAHELSTPLTPVAGYLQLLRRGRMGALSPQQTKALEAMGNAVARLARIVENLSDLASLEGPAALQLAQVDADALAEAVVAEVQPFARDARVELELRHAGEAYAVADGRKLRQALANVLATAVQFSPPGGAVLVEVTHDTDRLRLAVYDQGPGLSPAEADDVLAPFQRSARREELKRPGSGLALAVAARVAAAPGGRLVVESPPHTQPGLGSRYYSGAKLVLDLPLRPPSSATAPEPARASG